ncbi:MAG: YciI family protein [Pseudomonadota bacterium]
MLFAIRCLDKPNMAAKRAEIRPRHLEHMEEIRGQILLAGPMLADDGETPVGSIILAEFSDANAAQAFADGDPYAQSGIFEDVDIRPFRLTIAPAG